MSKKDSRGVLPVLSNGVTLCTSFANRRAYSHRLTVTADDHPGEFEYL
jgi:hypothetical protein